MLYSDDVNLIKCADRSYYLYGEVTVKQGHIQIAKWATVNIIVVPSDTTGTIEVENKRTVSAINAKNASTENVSIKNEGTIILPLVKQLLQVTNLRILIHNQRS